MTNETYIMDIVPNQKVKIKIKFLDTICSIEANKFLKSYKIPSLFFGKYFTKRLIKKIFRSNHYKYQFNKKFYWRKNFWDDIIFYKIKTEIIIPSNEFQNIEEKILQNTTPKRIEKILKYKRLILDSIDLGNPLFISSELLNSLGAEINNKDIIILDGSRRLVSSILASVNPEIVLLDFKNK